MTDSTDNKTAMPHPTLTKLVHNETPNYAFICAITKELYANAMSQQTSLGGGDHGHLGLLMQAADYAAIPGMVAGTAYNDPAFLGGQPNYPAAATANQIQAATEGWEEETQVYANH